MRRFFIFIISVVMLTSCGGGGRQADDSAGGMPSWISQTVALLERERLSIGDSVRLSEHYFLRLHLVDEARRCQADKDRHVSLDGSPDRLIEMMNRHGALAQHSYHPRHEGLRTTVLARKVEQAARLSVSPDEAERRAGEVIDTEIDFLPRLVFMLGAEYTPLEFAGRDVRQLKN